MRTSTTDSIVPPRKTWKPWKPVSRKNVEPYTPDDRVRFSSLYAGKYSKPGRNRKETPSTSVGASQPIAFDRWFSRSAWCETVSVAPELRSSAVLIVGTGHGVIDLKCPASAAGPSFGHTAEKSGQISL